MSERAMFKRDCVDARFSSNEVSFAFKSAMMDEFDILLVLERESSDFSCRFNSVKVSTSFDLYESEEKHTALSDVLRSFISSFRF